MNSLVVLKPDAVREHKVGELISRFEQAGYPISAMFMMTMYDTDVAQLYVDHLGKPFYPRLQEQMLSGPVVLMRVTGPVELVRGVALKIRQDYKRENPDNLVHASDSPLAAERELCVFGMEPE